MLAVGGSLGAFSRAGLSSTQYAISYRTFIDCLFGAAVGILIPVLGLDLIPGDITITDLTSLQQSCVAYIVGFAGDAAFTAVLWRFGVLRPENDGSTPKKGIFGKQEDKK